MGKQRQRKRTTKNTGPKPSKSFDELPPPPPEELVEEAPGKEEEEEERKEEGINLGPVDFTPYIPADTASKEASPTAPTDASTPEPVHQPRGAEHRHYEAIPTSADLASLPAHAHDNLGKLMQPNPKRNVDNMTGSNLKQRIDKRLELLVELIVSNKQYTGPLARDVQARDPYIMGILWTMAANREIGA